MSCSSVGSDNFFQMSLMSRETKDEYEILTDDDRDLYYNPSEETDFPLHVAIANNEEHVDARIQQLLRKDPRFLLKADDTPYGFTPLMLCATKNNVPAAEAIINSLTAEQVRDNLKVQDKRGYTAVHHAVPYPRMFELFKKAGADLTIPTTYTHATPQDLKDLITPTRDLKTISGNSVFVKLGEKLVTIDQAVVMGKLKSATNIESYRDIQFVPSEGWGLLWALPYQDLESIVAQGEPRYTGDPVEEEGLTQMFNNYMKVGHTAKMVLDQHKRIPNFGVFADEEGIKFKAVIGLYAGTVDPKENLAGTYVNGFVRADEIANHVSRINSGFPNCTYFDVCIKGTIYTIYIVTDPEGIPGKAEVLSSYGLNYSLRLGFREPYVLLGEDRMVKFFKRNIKEIYEEIKCLEVKIATSDSASFDDCLKLRDLSEKFMFPLENPTALLKLHYLKLVDLASWQPVLNDEDAAGMILNWNEQNSLIKDMFVQMMQFIQEFERSIKDQNLAKLVDQWMLNNLEKNGILKLAKALKLILKAKQNEGLTAETWTRFIAEQLDPFMQKPYDWKGDIANNPITKFKKPTVKIPASSTIPKDSSTPTISKKQDIED